MRFSLQKVEESFLKEAPWIIRCELELDQLSIDDCWAILQDDNAWKDWHPEVTDIRWESPRRNPGTARTVKFRDPVFNALLCGPIKLWEQFDIWEETPELKRMSFYASQVSKPKFLTYSGFREEFRVEKTGESSCKLTRTIGIAPSFVNRYVMGCITYNRLEYLFKKKPSEKFIELYNGKKSSGEEKPL